MKKLACAAVVILAAVGSLGAMFISQDQAIVSGVLNSLKLEPVPQKDRKIVGAPPQFKVTKATIDYLLQLQKDGKTVEVQANGELKVK